MTDLSASFFFFSSLSWPRNDVDGAVLPRNEELRPWTIISFCSLQKVLLLVLKENQISLPPDNFRSLVLRKQNHSFCSVMLRCSLLSCAWVSRDQALCRDHCSFWDFSLISQNLPNFSACIFTLVSKDFFFLMGMKVRMQQGEMRQRTSPFCFESAQFALLKMYLFALVNYENGSGFL